MMIAGFDWLKTRHEEDMRWIHEVVSRHDLDERLAHIVAKVEALAADFATLRRHEQTEPRTRPTWPVVVSRRPADAPRVIPWTASLRAFS